MVQPSIYSNLLSRNLGQHLQADLKKIPLLLVGCYLNPPFRGFEFVSDSKVRSDMRQKGEDMTRRLTRHFLNCTNTNDFDNGKSIESVEEPSENDECSASDGTNFSSIDSSVVGNMRTFSSLDLADSGSETSKHLDEVSVYNLMNLSQVKGDGEQFLKNEFPVFKFWYNRRRQHTTLFAVASRVLATPVSSSASIRVFSTVKLLVTDK